MKPSFFGTPEEKCAFIFGQQMKPCPECGSYDLISQNPIKLKESIPEDLDPRKILGIYARAIRDGRTELEGPCFIMCKDCGHHGPHVDCTGRTSEDVGQDPVVWAEMKRLWNEQ